MSQFINPFESIIQNGSAVSGGTLTFYDDGTTTLKDVYSDQALTTVAANPFQLDSHGRAVGLYLNGLYTVLLKDADGVILATQDGVGSSSTGGATDADTLDGKSPETTNVGDSIVARDEDGVSAFETIEVEKGVAASVDTSDDVMMRDDVNNELIPVPYSVFKSALAGMETGEIHGLEISNNSTDPTNDIDIATGSARGANGNDIFLTSGLTKRIDASWAAGDGNGGFPTALTLTSGTWYRVFLIYNNGTVDAGFDTSATAANLLADASGYDDYRRVGWVYWNGSSIGLFTQYGDLFTHDAPIQDNNSNASTTRSLLTLTAPPETVADVHIDYALAGGGVTAFVLLTSEDQSDTTPSSSVFHARSVNTGVFGYTGQADVSVKTSASSQVYERGSAATTLMINTKSWKDDRAQ